jgi:hypothetical protein
MKCGEDGAEGDGGLRCGKGKGKARNVKLEIRASKALDLGWSVVEREELLGTKMDRGWKCLWAGLVCLVITDLCSGSNEDT